MAVTTTPRDIILGAYGKSKKNQPQQIATEETELFDQVVRIVRVMYMLASRVNPAHQGDKSTIAGAASGWALPEGASTVFRIEKTDGTEVELVPIDDRTLSLGPSIYYYGRKYWPADAASPDPDPSSDSLVVFHTGRPTDPADLDTALDEGWDEDYNELLMLELAVYLALKDGRDVEVAALGAERDKWAALYLSSIELINTTEVRAFDLQSVANTNRVIPVSALLAGGSTLAL